jgi:quercetin dioxygenase-like cupin family protein
LFPGQGSPNLVALRRIRAAVADEKIPMGQEPGMSVDDTTQDVTSATSAVWGNHVPVPGTPDGFTARTTFPTNPDGVEVMLERWQAGTEEPPHSHPGDDMTVVVEGRMSVQFYREVARSLVPDGERVVLGKGDVGYIRAGRVHDAHYIEACRLVYVHNGAFAFHLAAAKVG